MVKLPRRWLHGFKLLGSVAAVVVASQVLSACSGPAGGEAVGVRDLPRIPWEGGSEYWTAFENARDWVDPEFFPIGLWYGSVDDSNDANWDKSFGINFYTGGLWKDTKFNSLTDARMYWVGERVNSEFDPNSSYWPGQFLDDEVDGRFDPPAGLERMQTLHDTIANPRQFLYANFSNMVAGPDLPLDSQEKYVNDYADVVSLDMYFYTIPFCDWRDPYRGELFAVPVPVETCRTSSSYGRMTSALREKDARDGELVPIWNFVELLSGAGGEGSFQRYIAPAELKGAVMSSLINEARGIVWFQQSFAGPCKTSQPLRDSQKQGGGFCADRQLEAMREINMLVHELAPILNTQSSEWDAGEGLQTMLKVVGDEAYLFAMADGVPGDVKIELPEGLSDEAEVIGEDRVVRVDSQTIDDSFPTESTFHIYRFSIDE